MWLAILEYNFMLNIVFSETQVIADRAINIFQNEKYQKFTSMQLRMSTNKRSINMSQNSGNVWKISMSMMNVLIRIFTFHFWCERCTCTMEDESDAQTFADETDIWPIRITNVH